MANKKEGKIGMDFFCFFCDVKCRDNYNLKKHYETEKHKRLTMANEKEGLYYTCNCGKKYKHSSSLSKHKKICNINYGNTIINKNNNYKDINCYYDNSNNNIINNNDLITLVKQQNEKIEQLEKTLKDSTQNNIVNNYSNNFNLNVFLNEKCKDAININEFQEVVKEAILDMSNVLNIKNTDGISNVFNLTYDKIDNYKKPYYSLDKSRQQLIIKDTNNKWVKDNNILYDIVKPLEKNYNKKQLYNFYEKIEDKNNIDDKQEEEFTNIILNTTCEIDKTKLIKNIIKNGLNPKNI